MLERIQGGCLRIERLTRKLFQAEEKVLLQVRLILVMLQPVIMHHQALVINDGFEMHGTPPERVNMFECLARVPSVEFCAFVGVPEI